MIMKHTLKRIVSFLIISFGLALVPVMVAQAAFTNQPNIINVERTAISPFPVLVEWELSRWATEGDVINDRVMVELRQDGTSGVSIGSIDLAADATSVSLDRDLFPTLKTHAKYGVIVIEVRDDDEEVDDSDTIYTGPPKLKRLKMRDLSNAITGTVTGTLRWFKPSSLNGESVRYVYQVRRNGKKKTLIKEGSSTGDINSIVLTGLPHTKMKVRVRVEDKSYTYGIGPWSAWKKFRASAKE